MGKILFIRGGAVGDFILTLPALRLVREGLSDNHVEVLGYPSIASLATATGLADETRSIEDAGLAPFFAPGAELDSAWSDYFASFDLVVSYLYDPDGFFSDNLERAGVGTLLRGPFRPEVADPPVAAARQLARPLEQIALFLDDPELNLDYAATVASPLPRSETTRVVLHPGSGSPSKNWSFESWLEVLGHLREAVESLEIVITCGEAERERIDVFLEEAKRMGLDCRGLVDRSLPELGALFGETDLYLGHDSGISHLAASAGTAGYLLFGPTDPGVWAPVSSRMHPIVSPTGNMGGITVRQVLSELESWTCSQRRG